MLALTWRFADKSLKKYSKTEEKKRKADDDHDDTGYRRNGVGLIALFLSYWYDVQLRTTK